MKPLIISFFGHADRYYFKEEGQKILTLLEQVVGNKPCYFYLGGYDIFDYFALKRCNKFISNHPNCKKYIVTPSTNPAFLVEHSSIVRLYDDLVFPAGLDNKAKKPETLERNKWVIENSDFIIFYVDHPYGIAYKSFRFAKKLKKNFANISNIYIL